MALEAATYINQLISTYPPGGDDRSTADDHLRLLKSVLQAQFPNFDNVAVNATPTELNGLAGFTALRVAVASATGVLEPSSVTAAQLAQLVSLTANRALYSDAAGLIQAHGTLTDTEMGYLAGITSALQAQLNDRVIAGHDHSGRATGATGMYYSGNFR